MCCFIYGFVPKISLHCIAGGWWEIIVGVVASSCVLEEDGKIQSIRGGGCAQSESFELNAKQYYYYY